MTNAGEMNLGLESLKGFGGKIVQALIGFVGTVVFARELGPTSFGGFYLLLTVVTFADRPVRGLIQACKKRYSETGSPKAEIVGGLFVGIAALALPLSVAGYLLRDLVYTLTQVGNAWIVGTVMFVTISLFIGLQSLLGASGRLGRQIWVDTARSVLTLPLQLGLVLTVGLGAAGMGYGLAAASLFTAAGVAYLLGHRPSSPSRETLSSLWEYAKYSIPTTFVGKAYGRLDILLIGLLLSAPAAVGRYEVAFKLTVPATFLYSVVGSGLMPKVSNRDSKGQSVAEDITNSVAYASLLPVPIFFGALALSKHLVVTVYGPEYASAAPLLVGLALYQIVVSQSEMHQSVIEGLDMPDVRLRVDTLSLSVNLLLGVPLVYAVGPIGAVAATVAAEMTRLVMSVLVVRAHVEGVEFVPRPLLAQLVAGAVMFATVYGGVNAVAVSGPLDLGLLVFGGAVVYAVVLVGASSHFRQTVETMWMQVDPRL